MRVKRSSLCFAEFCRVKARFVNERVFSKCFLLGGHSAIDYIERFLCVLLKPCYVSGIHNFKVLPFSLELLLELNFIILIYLITLMKLIKGIFIFLNSRDKLLGLPILFHFIPNPNITSVDTF